MTETFQDPGNERGSDLKAGVSAAAKATLPSRWRIFLLGSLALNLLFVGLAAGSLWSGKRHYSLMGNARGTSDLAIPGFIKSLPKERAKELRKLIKQQVSPDLTPLTAAIRQARRDAAAALAEATFDREKLTAAFSSIDVSEAAAKAAARSTLFALAQQLTPAERQILAERWKARRPHLFEDPPAPAEQRQKQSDEPPPSTGGE